MKKYYKYSKVGMLLLLSVIWYTPSQSQSLESYHQITSEGTANMGDFYVEESGTTKNMYLIGSMNQDITFNRWGVNRTLEDDPSTLDFFYASTNNSGVQYIYRISVSPTKENGNFVNKLAITDDFFYILGTFAGTLRIYDESGGQVADDSGNSVFSTTLDNSDILLIKIEKNTGKLRRVYRFGGEGNDFGDYITVDNNDNIIVSGRFSGTADFQINKTSRLPFFFPPARTEKSNGNDLFVVKYDSDNNDLLLNFQNFGGPEDQNKTLNITVNDDNEVFVAGRFIKRVEVGTFRLTTERSDQVFISKLNNDLSPTWLKLLENDSNERTEVFSMSLEEESQQLFVVGRIHGNASYDNTPLSTPTVEDNNLLILKVNSQNGALEKDKHIYGGEGYQDGRQIVFDETGNYYLAGTFHTDISINTNGLSKRLNNQNTDNIFIAAFNKNDHIVYLNGFVNSGEVLSNKEMYLFEAENQLSIYLALNFDSDLDVGLGSSQIISNSSGNNNAFLGMYQFHKIPIFTNGALLPDDEDDDISYTYESTATNITTNTFSSRFVDQSGVTTADITPTLDGETLIVDVPDDIVAGISYRLQLDFEEYRDIHPFTLFSIAPNVYPFEPPTYELPVTVIAGDNLNIPGRYFGNQTNGVSVFLVKEESGSEVETPAQVNSTAPNTIAISIPQAYPGQYRVRVTVNGVTTDGDSLTVMPQATEVTPANNTPGGNLTILGNTFIDSNHTEDLLEVRLIEEGNTENVISIKEFTTVEAGSIKLVLPDSDIIADGSYLVEVVVDGFVSNQQTIAIEDNMPVINTLQPISGSPGTEITITGLNLRATTVLVKINGTDATVVSASDTEIKATVPTLEPGAYQVVLSLNGTEYVLSDTFSITTPPVGIVITSLDPETTLSGNTVTVNGSNLDQATNITVGENEASFEEVDNTTLKFTIPDLFPGDYQIKISGGEGEEPAIYESLRVTHVISNLSETEISASSEITISGSNFRSAASPPDIQVLLNDVAVENITINETGTDITFTFAVTEEMRGEEFEVKVVVNGISVTAAESVTIIEEPTDTTEPEVSFLPGLWNNNEVSIAIQAADPETGIAKVEVAFAGIMDEAYGAFQEITLSEDSYSFSSSAGDELGLKYQFRVTNGAGTSKLVSEATYRSYDLGIGVLPAIFGDSPGKNNYRIIAVPFETQSVSQTLGNIQYDKENWRLFRLNPSATAENPYQEYNAGFSQFKPGEGYWLIAKSGILDSIQGGVARPNEEGTISIPVSEGWNLIGNPYPFNIDWDVVKAANPDIKFMDEARVSKYKGEGETYVKNDNTLEDYEGAFVNIEEAGNLLIPFSAKSTANRTQKNEKEGVVSLDAPVWQIDLSVHIAKDIMQNLKLGMHQEAKFERDFYDADVFPSFFGSPAAFFNREGKSLETDIIPPSSFAEWSLVLTEKAVNQQLVLDWNNQKWKNHQYQLWLYNEMTREVIDMQATQSYQFYPSGDKQKLSVLYGKESDLLQHVLPATLHIGKAFPNPATDYIKLTVMVPDHGETSASWQILDMTGRIVKSGGLSLSHGIHQASLTLAGQPGVYMLKVISSKNVLLNQQRIIIK